MEAIIEEHEEDAELAIVAMAFVLNLGAFATMAWIGHYGGQIRPSELRQR